MLNLRVSKRFVGRRNANMRYYAQLGQIPVGAGSYDAHGVRDLRKIEGAMEDIINRTPREFREKYEELWTDKDNFDLGASQQGEPNPFDSTEDFPKPYDKLDLNTNEGFGKAISYLSVDKTTQIMQHPTVKIPYYITEEILKVGRHTRVTAAGRVFSFSVLIMMGCGKGTAGLGYGRGPTIPQATDMAKLNAEKNIMSLVLHRGNSIGADIKFKYKKSYVRMKACRTGWGTNAGWDMKIVLDSFGITDVSANLGGSRNKATRYRAIFMGLMKGVRTKEEVSRILGRKLFNKQKMWYNASE
jgi:small subunit ribosomal protein S5